MKTALKLGALLLLLVASAASSRAVNIFTVANTNDSGFASLRNAILGVNSFPAGSNLIRFMIPGEGVQTIAPVTPLPAISNTVTIDGYSQSGSRANTLESGSDAILRIRLDGVNLTNGFPTGLSFSGADSNVVRGLVIVRFSTGIQLDSSLGSRITGNWIGLDADGVSRGNRNIGIDVTSLAFDPCAFNLVGGTAPADRNVISGNGTGISFFPMTVFNNTVQGNFIGTDITGTVPRGNTFIGINVHAATNLVIGGSAPGAGNVIAGGMTGLSFLATTGDVIQGNRIGTDLTGRLDLGNNNLGMLLQACESITVGGPGAGNLFCNSRQYGISLVGSSRVTIQGNHIGTGYDPTWAMGNSLDGIYIQGANTNLIGGTTPGAANFIGYNGNAGVNVVQGVANTISRNWIFDNEGLGIDLYFDGEVPNDPNDPDTGSNQLQNYPVLDSATAAFGSTQVQGLLNSIPNSAFRLEFFASPAWDAKDRAEGQLFLGDTTVTTQPDGNAVFSVSLPVWAPSNTVITATATDALGNTSEFSVPVAVASGPPSVALTIAPVGDGVVLSWSSRAEGFLLEATEDSLGTTNWQPVAGPIFDIDGVKSIHVSNSGNSRFFRLRK
jgi:hypothetical protein